MSIDDFGTGFFSLSGMKDIAADELKIDKSFVLNMQASKADRKIVEQVIALGHAFDLEVVAVGVENESVAQDLATMGCDCMQGFHFAKPLSPQEIPGWINAWRHAPRA